MLIIPPITLRSIPRRFRFLSVSRMADVLSTSGSVSTPANRTSERNFGLVFAAAFAATAVYPAFRGGAGALRAWALAASAAFLLVALFRPRLLELPNRLWFRLGLLLHRIISPIALAVMFFGVVTPTGLIMRACGRDLLRLRRDKAAASYWVRRQPPGPPPQSMHQPF
jgi:saxitoxin biosynthesis operon SxtJ-like protein